MSNVDIEGYEDEWPDEDCWPAQDDDWDLPDDSFDARPWRLQPDEWVPIDDL